MNDDTRPEQNMTGYVPLIKFTAHKIIDVMKIVNGMFLKIRCHNDHYDEKRRDHLPICKIAKWRSCY